MKSNIFLVLIFLLIAGGIYMFTNKGDNGFFNFSLSNGTILPKSEWEKTLVGHWKIESITRSTSGILRLKGDVEYKEDKSLVRYINLKYYENTGNQGVVEEKRYLDVESGGRIEGTWNISEKGDYWTEVITDCMGEPSHHESNEAGINSHCSFFMKGELYDYGTFNSSKSKHKLITFTSNKIVIESENFNDDGKQTYRLYR